MGTFKKKTVLTQSIILKEFLLQFENCKTKRFNNLHRAVSSTLMPKTQIHVGFDINSEVLFWSIDKFSEEIIVPVARKMMRKINVYNNNLIIFSKLNLPFIDGGSLIDGGSHSCRIVADCISARILSVNRYDSSPTGIMSISVRIDMGFTLLKLGVE
uniref:Uncharacterized protein n=1 Tax=viral metagenome TaxID=1070528 RepID=A0A6H1ZX64_9ZZZZ